MQRFFLDARKLGDGGIGTFIETLIEGAIEYNNSERPPITLDIIVSKLFLKTYGLPSTWEKSSHLHFFTDDTKKYSISEYVTFPLKWNHIIKSADLYISPHYTLPLGIKTKKLVIVHDVIQVEFPEKISHYVIPRLLIKSALRRADFVATVSNHSKERISTICDFPQNDIHRIPNAVRPIFRSSMKNFNAKTQPHFLFVGSDRLHKQVDVFIEFLQLLKKSSVPFKASIISNLSEWNMKLIKENALNENVEIYSEVTNNTLFEIFHSATFYVCTSLDEGFCIPMLDAMSVHLPVICPDTTFARELTKDNAIFYACGSAADLYYQFTKCYHETQTLSSHVENAYIVSQQYTPLKQFESLLACV